MIKNTQTSILFPIHNKIEFTKYYLPKLIECLEYTDSTDRYEIIVIDDGSTDGSAEWINGNYPQIHLLKGDGNVWWSGAINIGARFAIEILHTDYVLLWNNDILPEENYFKILSSLINQGIYNKIVGSKILIKGENKIWSLGGYLNQYTGVYKMIQKYENNKNNINWQPGMGTLIHKDIVIKTNYWDNENFPQYHGDSDFCLRAREKGVEIVTCSSLILYNDLSNTGFQVNTLSDYFKSLKGIKSNWDIKRRIMFYKRHTKGLLPFIWLIKVYIHIFLATIKKQFKKKMTLC